MSPSSSAIGAKTACMWLRPGRSTPISADFGGLRMDCSIPVLVYIIQAKAGLPWFMLVYRRREPDNSSKIARRYNYKQVGRALFFSFFFFFMLKHRRFRFFPCLREQPGRQSSVRLPSSKYLRSYGKHNKLFLVLFRIIPTAFPFEKDGCQHSSSSPFPAGNHEYTFEDWRERTKKLMRTAKIQKKSVEKVARIFFPNFVLV